MFKYEDTTPDEYRAAKSGEFRYNNKELMNRTHKSKQVGGDHYSKHTIQPWDIVDEYGLDHYRGTAIKYILRNKMDPHEDIRKAIHCLEHWLEVSNGS